MAQGWHRRLRRAARRAWFRAQARGMPLVYDARYERGVFGVPLDPMRGEKILASLDDAGLLAKRALWAPRAASLENLRRVHTDEYLQRVQEPEVMSQICGVAMTAEEAEAGVDLQRLMAGGTIQATRLAVQTGGIAAHLGGGFHHALPDKGMGFCVFNDVAVAILRLRGRGFAEPILVVDLDVHDGNGTRAVFADDPSVYTYSLHNDHWGPAEAVASTSIALGPDVDDTRLMEALEDTLPPVVKEHRPGLVIYLAGTDAAGDDQLGNWNLTEPGIFERDRFVTLTVRGQRRTHPPMAVVLAGGYGGRAWRYSARYLLWVASGRELDPPPEQALTLERFRRIGQSLDETEDDGLAFDLSEEDLFGLVPGGSTAPRFLGYFSRHAVELLLERAGLLAQMKAKGYRRLRVELDNREGLGQTVRVLSEDEPESVLMELRAERRRGVAPDLEVIALEWLLLQNPRGEFSPRRPQLPGQQHPGLGLLRDIMGWLLVVCEQHGLDGIAFTAAHYHIAVQSRRLVKPLRPEDEARMRALEKALEGLSLPQATAAVAAGQVKDGQTGEAVPWAPVTTLLPVSERARGLVSGAEYQKAVEEATRTLDYRYEGAAVH